MAEQDKLKTKRNEIERMLKSHYSIKGVPIMLNSYEALIRQDVAREIFEEIESYVVKCRREFDGKRDEQGWFKNVNAQIILGAKLNAFQQVIDKIQSLKSHYLGEGK